MTMPPSQSGRAMERKVQRKIDKSGGQKDAEASVQGFEDDLGPFVVATMSTRMAMVFADASEPDKPIVFANDSFLSLTGYARDEVLGQSFDFLLAHAADPHGRAKIEAEFAGNAGEGSEILYRRKDGSEFWAALFISPVRDASGEIVQYFASFVDLSQHKREQAHAQLLIDELNHRVKNILATVQSIVWQVLRRESDPAAIREGIQTRLTGLSRSHDLLTERDWQGSGLRDVLDTALEPFQVPHRGAERIVITGENIHLPPKAVLALGIAFNELATNAIKYGALSNATGSIHVRWMIEPKPEGDRLLIFWEEKDGPPVPPPSRIGFGSVVLGRGLARELSGVIQPDFRPDGFRLKVDMPAP